MSMQQQQSAAVTRESDDRSLPLQVQGLGIDGWRRFLLYTLILFLSVIVSVNTALTIWILSLVNASSVCASFSALCSSRLPGTLSLLAFGQK